MLPAFKQAIGYCKTLLRNGYDAHIINANLQEKLLATDQPIHIDIACEPNYDTLIKIFKNIDPPEKPGYAGCITEDGITVHFFRMGAEDSAHPEKGLLRIAPRMVENLDVTERMEKFLSNFTTSDDKDVYKGFESLDEGCIRFAGIPDDVLRRNYLLAIRALRFAANFNLPVEPNSWIAIVRASSRVLDYVPMIEIMNEWHKVTAECMWKFVQLMHDAHILQGLIPEVASLTRVRQRKNDDSNEEINVFSHTILCMKHYAEEAFCYDWLGTLAMLFHNVGKLYTAEYFDNEWTFYQQHRVGAKVTRKILRRLHFSPEDMDLICHLVRYHMRFRFMLTDRGIRRFKALDEYPRLIEMSRADIKARDAGYTYFNHNMKYLERAETPEQMLEPLLNGNEIMTHTNLPPGPMIGVLRDALLQAQIAGEVENGEDAIAFVKVYAQQNVG